MMVQEPTAEAASFLDDVTARGGVEPCRLPGTDHWVVSTYADALHVLADEDSFSPWNGMDRLDEETARRLTLPAPPTPLLFISGQRHSAVRRQLGRPFQLQRYRGRIDSEMRTVAGQLTRRIAAAGEADIMAAFAGPLARRVLARLYGISVAQWHLLRAGGFGSLPWLPNEQLVTDTVLRHAWVGDYEAAVEFRRQLLAEIAQRMSESEDDALSDMVATIGETVVTEGDIVSLIEVTDQSGLESFASAICLAVVEIARQPSVMTAARSDQRRLRLAVEEVLRLLPPGRGVHRRALRTLRLGGTVIPEGGVVLVWLESANRDPRRMVRPHDFVLDRLHRYGHLAFGHGAHRCLAASFVRYATCQAVTALLNELGPVWHDGACPIQFAPAPYERRVTTAGIRWINDPKPNAAGQSEATP